MKLLLVEDDRAIAASLSEGLAADGHEVAHVTSGAEAIAAATSDRAYDMVLLDLGLPDVDGREVCRAIRQVSTVPLIMISAREEEFDRVLGLELGADDYITKPFSMREVLARIRAVGRRTSAAPSPASSSDETIEGPKRIGPLAIDRRTRRVALDDRNIELTAKEFDVLACLADDAGAVRTRSEILEEVWDSNWFGPTKTVDAHVAAIRKKLGDHRWIAAVRAVGFRLEIPPDGGP